MRVRGLWAVMMNEAGAAGGDAGAGGAGGEGDAGGAPVGGDAGGDSAAAWDSALTDDHRGFVGSRGWKGPGDILNSYQKLEQLRGVPEDRLVKLPAAEDPNADWDSVYSRLGRPEAPDGYQFKPELPEGQEDVLTGPFREWAHANGLSERQFEGLVKSFVEWEGTSFEGLQKEQQEARDAAVTELQKEWGQAYDRKLQQAQAAAKELGIDNDKLEELNRSIGDHVSFMRIFANLGERMAEGRSGDGSGGGGLGSVSDGFGMSPGEAQSRVVELQGDAEFMKAYLTRSHPGHKAAVERMTKLQQKANPE